MLFFAYRIPIFEGWPSVSPLLIHALAILAFSFSISAFFSSIITEFFDNEEEMAKFQKWREEQKELENKKKKEEVVA